MTYDKNTCVAYSETVFVVPGARLLTMAVSSKIKTSTAGQLAFSCGGIRPSKQPTKSDFFPAQFLTIWLWDVMKWLSSWLISQQRSTYQCQPVEHWPEADNWLPVNLFFAASPQVVSLSVGGISHFSVGGDSHFHGLTCLNISASAFTTGPLIGNPLLFKTGSKALRLK